ncbi:MAG: GNAT family N-acetyltransferase [Longimicrobiales bacterium]
MTDSDPGTPANGRLPDLAIETVARGFFREADRYGFSQADYLRFINSVLSLSMAASGAGTPGSLDPVALRPDASGNLPLSDEHVCIRSFDPAADMQTFAHWMEDEDGAQFLRAGTTMRPLALDSVIANPASMLATVTLPDGTPIGATAFLEVDLEQRKAEMRKLIGEPRMRGRGYAKAATRLWIGFGLRTLGLHKIYINTLNTNLRNVRLNEALGFKLEGILHDEVFADGRYHDVLRMAIWEE